MWWAAEPWNLLRCKRPLGLADQYKQAPATNWGGKGGITFVRNLKRTASLLLAVLLVVSVWLPVRSQAASAFLSGGGTVTVGEIFTVDYTISGSQLEGAAGSVTSSNPAVAQLVSVSIANGWSGIAGGSFSVYGDPIDGSTTVLRATFRAVAAGSCTIS